VDSGLDANASAANATLPLIMSRRQSWEFMTGKLVPCGELSNFHPAEVEAVSFVEIGHWALDLHLCLRFSPQSTKS
jgi:hypothetical protein